MRRTLAPLRRMVPMPRLLKETASFAGFAIRRFYADNLGQSAGALTYSTLLALVPLMVITFAVLSGFPAFNEVSERIEELFFEIFVPEVGAEIRSYLSRFSGNASNLTAFGTAALAVTAVLLLWTIEVTLNSIWRVETPRSIGVRLLIYWTVLTLGPLLLGLSFAVNTGVLSSALQWARSGGGDAGVPATALSVALSILTQSLAFMLLYKLVPARPVRLRDAAIGGAIAGVAFHLLRWGFNSFLTSGTTYETIYGAVAVLPIFLVWIYSSWTVIILGAVFAASFPDWWKTRDPDPGTDLSPARRLELAVAVLGVLARRSREGGAVSAAALQDAAPLDIREDIVARLERTGYVVKTESDCYSLSRDIYLTTVADLARDLGLALGLDPAPIAEDDPHRRAFDDLRRAAGSLPEVLSRLHDAESAILNRPLAEVVAPTEEDARQFKVIGQAARAGE